MDDHDDDDEGPPGQGPTADSAVDSASEGHSKSSQNFAWPQDYRTPSLLSLLLLLLLLLCRIGKTKPWIVGFQVCAGVCILLMLVWASQT